MKTEDSYKYAFGTVEKLKGADFENMLTSDKISDFNFNNGSGLILPEFIGVYQVRDYSPEFEDEEYDFPFEILEDSFGSVIGHLLHMDEVSQIDSDLISIIYQKDSGWKPSIIRENMLGDYSNRVAILNENDLPDFYQKDTSAMLSIIWRDLKDSYRLDHKNRQKEFIKKWSKQIDSIAKQRSTYGLTEPEYASFRVLQELKQAIS